MRALFQVTIGVDVEDHEEAARVALLMDNSMQLNVLAVLEQHGVTVEEASEVCEWYGTNVIFPSALERRT